MTSTDLKFILHRKKLNVSLRCARIERFSFLNINGLLIFLYNGQDIVSGIVKHSASFLEHVR